MASAFDAAAADVAMIFSAADTLMLLFAIFHFHAPDIALFFAAFSFIFAAFHFDADYADSVFFFFAISPTPLIFALFFRFCHFAFFAIFFAIIFAALFFAFY